jgi:hypothetical protein
VDARECAPCVQGPDMFLEREVNDATYFTECFRSLDGCVVLKPTHRQLQNRFSYSQDIIYIN